MRSSGAAVAIVLLLILAGGLGLLFYQRHLTVQDLRQTLEGGSMETIAADNPHVKQAREDLESTRQDLEDVRATLRETEAELEQIQAVAQGRKATIDQLNRSKRNLQNDVDSLQSKLDDLEERFSELEAKATEPDPVIAQLRADLETEKQRADQLQEQVKEEKTRRLAAIEEAKKEIATLRTQISHQRRVISDYTIVGKRRAEEGKEEYDGEVLTVDTENGFVVTNLGEVDRVRKGMRFDVIRWRYNRWDTIASIEVNKVNDATSTGIILPEKSYRLVCPLCGWEGEPGMRHCPYCRRQITLTAGGEERVETVALVREEVTTAKGMDVRDPIIKGDKVTNPFYSRERELAFAVAGQPQEFSRAELRTLIEEHGGQMLDEVDVDTDYLILCQIPDRAALEENEELEELYKRATERKETATQYGIPILREVQLLDFFGP